MYEKYSKIKQICFIDETDICFAMSYYQRDTGGRLDIYIDAISPWYAREINVF